MTDIVEILPVRCIVQRCVETAKPSIIIVRGLRRADDTIQKQALTNDGVWQDYTSEGEVDRHYLT